MSSLAARAAAADAESGAEPSGGPAVDPLQDLWDAMEGQEGVTLSEGAKGFLAAVYVSHTACDDPNLNPDCSQNPEAELDRKFILYPAYTLVVP